MAWSTCISWDITDASPSLPAFLQLLSSCSPRKVPILTCWGEEQQNHYDLTAVSPPSLPACHLTTSPFPPSKDRHSPSIIQAHQEIVQDSAKHQVQPPTYCLYSSFSSPLCSSMPTAPSPESINRYRQLGGYRDRLHIKFQKTMARRILLLQNMI
jgi:hypothetical protein